jgi:sodium/hydrogen antiporter
MTRHVIRGNQDIVINRDSDMERGEATVRGDETPRTEKVAESGSSQTQTQAEESPQQERGDDFRKENPPDGKEIVAEWKEGPHNVVEKRAGPGEEVRPICLLLELTC